MSLFLEKLRIMQGILPFGNSVATFEHKGGEQQYTLEMVTISMVRLNIRKEAVNGMVLLNLMRCLAEP